MRHPYNLGFISDENLFKHVKDTLARLTSAIDLSEFKKNVVDPIKLVFEVHAYKRTPEQAIEHEIARQLGKTLESAIGFFHQHIFNYIKGWSVPKDGVDVVNDTMTIFGEIKNKHNTMNSSSAKTVFEKLKGIVVGNSRATAYLIEIIAKKSRDEAWHIAGYSLVGEKAERVRIISIDRFLALATTDNNAFKNLCAVLGLVVDDVLQEYPAQAFKNTVLSELQQVYPDVIKGIFLSSFSTYNGFDDFNERKQ